MNSNTRVWQELGAAWRGADWTGCVGILRPIVEELPEVLSTRLLLAGFATRARNNGLAMLHYEKLMVLAVGQGELFHGLAAERGLDALRHDENAHRKRVQALQQWFKTMPPRSRGRKQVALPQSWIVDLPAGEFRRYAEASRLLVLPSGPQVFEDAPNLFAIVLHGAANWTYLPAGEAPLPAVAAGSGDLISVPSGCHDGDRVSVEAQEPAILLCFEGDVAVSLRERVSVERRTAIAPRPAKAETRNAPGSSPPRPSRIPDSGNRPVPDPVLEPMVSQRPSPEDRRREHELIVRFASGVAELGIAGTRTGAIAGRLSDLSPAGFTIALPRATVRQSRAALEGAHIVTLLMLPAEDEPLRLATRVTGLTFEPGGIGGTPHAQLAVEFVLLLAPDRARLQEALIEATRAGQWPGSEPAATALDESRPAA